MTATTGKSALIIGASRGLGYALELSPCASSRHCRISYLDYRGQTVRW